MVKQSVFSLFVLLLLGSLSVFSYAQIGSNSLSDPFSEEPQFLQVDEAFKFDFEQKGDQLTVKFDIADGYYLYKKQFRVTVKGATLGEPVYPDTFVQIEDEFFGISDVFYQGVQITYPITESKKDATVAFRFQGCADAGLCYPPTIKQIYLNEVSTGDSTESASSGARSQQFDLADKLAGEESLWIALAAFLGLGILLGFTPCVFPMYPILSGIVIGQGKEVKTSKAFTLSFVYVQGMAITYSLLGLVVASAGVQFQAALQNPILLSVFIIVFVLLALAMFGAYELQLPSSWQERLNNLSNNQKRGNMVGVFVMGILSGLIASPCTTAPLTAILLYIAQSGDMVLGFFALYVLSIGMGIPLIIFGITGGKLLPKAGNWMNVVKATFGFMMLAVAIFFIERMWISEYSLLLYAGLGLGMFTYYFVMNANSATTFWKGVRTLLIFLGLFSSAMLAYRVIFPPQVVAVAASGDSAATLNKKGHPEFIIVKNLADLKEKVAAANAQGQSVMVDLYADWCVACKEFEKYTFPDPAVLAALSNTAWMQIDLTHNTPEGLAFQEHFSIFGLPTILFFDEQGNELTQSRITGFMRAEPFAQHVEAALNQ
ncbi:protein-disulfide reductase DsbD [Alteromonas sediminis]|uniref:Thiol:disulfide interchange protein DsbD n=1 Tax=Alteromonas sediminis TaxID=2259342 RepID=A0A3N5XZM9_9ALTE|nr:protein-disulfide reductase DsbD [Alteromonas sediminis]RPJ66582.1 protein-disulfide reductase DsbD [Alteromonas sediminis]